MKSLREALTIRDSVFDETKRDDTLDLSSLINKSVDTKRFFDETFITPGMELLFDTAFKRFRGQAANGLIKLTQAMGGGKTHNMVALGVMATNPELRTTILNGKYKDFTQRIRVVAYTGRESDLNFGIWGEIARQLGKESDFAPYYSPLKAPGQSAWINLLKSDMPTLIMLDELPPYLEYCKTQDYGTGTLLDITTTALANLFNALNKEELFNVCLVVSDLKATYEQGSQIIQGIFDNLDNEMNRSATNIEPVSANTDDLYNILRTRLFSNTVPDSDIDDIAMAYQMKVKEAREMNLTDENPSDIAKGIRASYPFHPSLRDLFARFKENPGFQQTRGFIRLTRIMVKSLYKKDGLADFRYLINPFDMDLNDSEMVTLIKNIKPELTNAIAHDVASHGTAVAEHIDGITKTTDMQDVTKLILMSSLSKVTGSVVGLAMNEIMAYIAAPGRDITSVTKGMEELKTKAWYLYFDRDKRIYFRKVQNVNAQLNDEVRGFTYDQAKLHIKELLANQFKPTQKDCYQDVLVFPSIEEIELKKDKVLLILTEPGGDAGLKPEVRQFYSDSIYKNRVMFLTGQRVAMDNLIDITKSYKAIENIIYRMEHEDKVEAKDSELVQAKDLSDKISAKLFSNIREAFVTLYFPKRAGLTSKDFKMEFVGNNFNAEKQIRDVLIEEMKFTTEIEPSRLKERFEARIFTTQRMTWPHLMERVATEESWTWHKPEALNELKGFCIMRGFWIEDGGYIDKDPPKPETSVSVIEIHRDDSGEVTLKILPTNGDTVYYEIDSPATEGSMKINDLSSFKTRELKLTFLCVDSKGVNKTGNIYEWKNNVSVKYRLFDNAGSRFIELRATSPNVEIRYTTDGSNPKNSGGKYIEPFAIPAGSKFVQAIASNEAKGVYSETLQFEVKETEKKLDPAKPVRMNEPLMPTSTAESFKTLDNLKEVNAKLKGVDLTVQERNGNGFIILNMGEFEVTDITGLIEQLNQIIDKFFFDKKYDISSTINSVTFTSGKDFEQWVSKQGTTVDSYLKKITQ
jgi:hypothetical protein